MRRGTWLALAAMVLQLVLSFGHMHPEDFFPPAGPGAKILAAADSGAAPQVPAKPAPGDAAHDDCAICANMQMAAALLLPDPVLLLPPADFGMAAPRVTIALLLTAPPHLLFQTRAPPITA
jgi:hypothetical protein